MFYPHQLILANDNNEMVGGLVVEEKAVAAAREDSAVVAKAGAGVGSVVVVGIFRGSVTSRLSSFLQLHGGGHSRSHDRRTEMGWPFGVGHETRGASQG